MFNNIRVILSDSFRPDIADRTCYGPRTQGKADLRTLSAKKSTQLHCYTTKQLGLSSYKYLQKKITKKTFSL